MKKCLRTAVIVNAVLLAINIPSVMAGRVGSIPTGSLSDGYDAQPDLDQGTKNNTNLDVPNAVPAFTEFYTLPQGTNLFRSRSDGLCLTFNAPLTPYNVFSNSSSSVDVGDIEFITGPASTVAAIQYSAQASLGQSAAANQIRIKCSYSQQGAPWTNAFTTCSGQGINGSVVVRNTGPNFSSNTTLPGYNGYANNLQPNTLTRVRITADQIAVTSTISQICHSNINIAF